MALLYQVTRFDTLWAKSGHSETASDEHPHALWVHSKKIQIPLEIQNFVRLILRWKRSAVEHAIILVYII